MPAKQNRLSLLHEKLGIYLIALLLLGVGTLASDEFLSANNLLEILNGVALLGMVATGMAFITFSGNMADLSLPSVMALTGIVTVESMKSGSGLCTAILLGILAGMSIGLINGLIVGHFNANPILWTLAVAFFMEGFMRFTWSNAQSYPDTTPGSPGAQFIELFRLKAGPVPLAVIIMFFMFLLAHLVLTRTRFGVETSLVGSSKATAKTSGINAQQVVLMDFLAASFAAAIAGIFIASMNKLGVFYLGKGYDFKAVTAVVLGGMMLSGGRGNMFGVLGGVLVIGLLTNIMDLWELQTSLFGILSGPETFKFSRFTQNIVIGTVFICVVGFHQYQLRKRGKDYA